MAGCLGVFQDDTTRSPLLLAPWEEWGAGWAPGGWTSPSKSRKQTLLQGASSLMEKALP